MSNYFAQDTALQTYTIDPSHSQVNFAVRHMGFSKVRGRFERFEGMIDVDPENLDHMEVEVNVDAASITTGDAKRDEHLRSGDFFDVKKHPRLSFTGVHVEEVRGNAFTLVGNLTIAGITKRVELEGQYLGSATDPWGGDRVAFEARTTINRKDFGLNWNAVLETGGFLVSDNVEIELEVQAVRQDA